MRDMLVTFVMILGSILVLAYCVRDRDRTPAHVPESIKHEVPFDGWDTAVSYVGSGVTVIAIHPPVARYETDCVYIMAQTETGLTLIDKRCEE